MEYAMRSLADDPRTTPARPDLAAAHLRGICLAGRYAEGMLHSVVAGITALRGAPDCSVGQLTELLYGERFMVYEDRGGWLWGQAELDGYVGYAERTAFRAGAMPADYVVKSLFAHLYSEPTGRSTTTALLPMTARLSLGDPSDCGRFRRIRGSDEYIFTRHVRPLVAPETDHVAVAERFLGVPYLWGGKSAGGIDCSGLVQVSLLACNRPFPRDSDQQLQACRQDAGHEVGRHDAMRGDIAFFPGHVGIMLDNERLLHANATHMAVTTDPLDEVMSRVARDHRVPLLGIYRLPGMSASV